MSMVICKLPRAGLGNQLFPLMEAYTFAYLNHLPVIVINYHRIKPGPWLRGEKNKRNYKGFFVFQKNWLAEQVDKWRIVTGRTYLQVIEPSLAILEKKDVTTSYIFSEIPHYSKRFEELKDHRQLVIKLLYEIISPSIKQKISQLPIPCIGIHIRMGDFRSLVKGEEFGKVGAVRTPENYFVTMINEIRQLHGTELPVSIFTDGERKELNTLFQLPGIRMVKGNNDLVDLLLLSKSRIIITSAGSTFSYWAAFVSDAVVIMHPTYANIKIRPKNVWSSLYEGAFDGNNPQFVKAIQSIG